MCKYSRDQSVILFQPRLEGPSLAATAVRLLKFVSRMNLVRWALSFLDSAFGCGLVGSGHATVTRGNGLGLPHLDPTVPLGIFCCHSYAMLGTKQSNVWKLHGRSGPECGAESTAARLTVIVA
jgi:hypothetical protein